MAHRRLLFYSQDGLGLGHLRRATNIAREVIAREPDARILIVADSPTMSHPPVPGVEFVKLPTIIKANRGTWVTGTFDIEIEAALELRARMVLEIYRAFRPEAVLVDHMPVGALGELRSTIAEIARSRPRPKLVLGLRDILDEPTVIQESWEAAGAYDILPVYDTVLLYGCRDIYDADQAYGLGRFAERVVYCGYVSRNLAPVAPESRVSKTPFVLMMGGGGHDAFPLARAFHQAFPSIAANRRMKAIVVAGPNMGRAEQQFLVEGRAPGVRIERDLPDTTALAGRAAAIVTMGGYNSLCEALALRSRTLVVPRAGPSQEQRMRCRLFAARELISWLDPVDLTAESLLGALGRLIDSDDIPRHDNIPSLDGARRAAAHLLDLEPGDRVLRADAGEEAELSDRPITTTVR